MSRPTSSAVPTQAGAIHGTTGRRLGLRINATLIAGVLPLTSCNRHDRRAFPAVRMDCVHIIDDNITSGAVAHPDALLAASASQQQHGKLYNLLVYSELTRALAAFDNGVFAWASFRVVSHKITDAHRLHGHLLRSLVLSSLSEPTFFRLPTNARLGVNLELPIGTRVEIAQEVTSVLPAVAREVPRIMVLNYTTGQASGATNTSLASATTAPISCR